MTVWLDRVAVVVKALFDASQGHGEGGEEKAVRDEHEQSDEVWTRRGREFKQAESLTRNSE